MERCISGLGDAIAGGASLVASRSLRESGPREEHRMDAHGVRARTCAWGARSVASRQGRDVRLSPEAMAPDAPCDRRRLRPSPEASRLSRFADSITATPPPPPARSISSEPIRRLDHRGVVRPAPSPPPPERRRATGDASAPPPEASRLNRFAALSTSRARATPPVRLRTASDACTGARVMETAKTRCGLDPRALAERTTDRQAVGTPPINRAAACRPLHCRAAGRCGQRAGAPPSRWSGRTHRGDDGAPSPLPPQEEGRRHCGWTGPLRFPSAPPSRRTHAAPGARGACRRSRDGRTGVGRIAPAPPPQDGAILFPRRRCAHRMARPFPPRLRLAANHAPVRFGGTRFAPLHGRPSPCGGGACVRLVLRRRDHDGRTLPFRRRRNLRREGGGGGRGGVHSGSGGGGEEASAAEAAGRGRAGLH